MGNNSGLQFSSTGSVNFTAFTPQITSTIISTNEFSSASATAMDNSGNLVFYTDGKHIWDWNNNLITGALLGGNTFGPLYVIVVPKPCTCDTFFVFTSDASSKNIIASIVVKTAAGLIIPELNQIVCTNTNPGGYFPLAAMYNTQQKKYWIISQTNIAKPSPTQTDLSFRAIPITCNTKSVHDITPGIISSVSYTFANNNTVISPVSLKFSNAGNNLGYVGIGGVISNVVGVLDFDKTTGIVSLASSISGFNNSFTGFIPQGYNLIRDIRPYDIEFSPNDTKVYVSALDNYNFGPTPPSSYHINRIYKFDITSQPLPTGGIPYELGSFNPVPFSYRVPANLSLAPDGKIYFSKYGYPDLGRIDNPNATGSFSTFQVNTPGMIFANAAVSTGGLPNIVKGYVADVCPTSCGLILNTLTKHASCNALAGSSTVTTTGGTAPYTFLWNTLPPQNTQTANGLFPGNYTVVATDNNGCAESTTVTVIKEPCPSCGCGSWNVLTVNNLNSYYCGATINWGCNEDFDFMSSFSCCNQSLNCTPAYNWDIKFNGAVIKTGTIFNTTASTFKATANGLYTITIYANCNGISCNPCVYYVNVTDCLPSPDCCTGGNWINKTISWDILPLVTKNESNKEAKVIIPKIVDINTEMNSTVFKFPEISKCDSVYHLNQNGTYRFNAAYSCNPNLPNCNSNIKVRIDGPAHSGLYNSPVTKTFTQAGNYTITYIAYCGNLICDSCKFTLTIDKDCCLGSGWVSKTFAKVNLDYSSSAPAPLVGLFDLPIGIKPIIYASKAVNVMLNFKCADGCGTPSFQLLQKDLSKNITIVNTTITGTIASIYTYANKTRVWIKPLCGGKLCGNPLIFDIQCNARFCPANYPVPHF
jgi:SprB repeat